MMGTIADKLVYLDETKQDLRRALAIRGVSVDGATPFRQYTSGVHSLAWAPDLLFQNSEQGVFYYPLPQFLYQDAAGTVPVTVDGDPVGYMQDLSGNNNHATQSVSEARPLYRTDGTLHWLEFDGADDYLNSGYVAGGAGNTLSAAGEIANNYNILLGTQDGGGRLFLAQGEGLGSAGWGDASYSTITGGSGVGKRVLLLTGKTGDVLFRNNGVDAYSGAPTGNPNTVNPLYVGAHNLGGTPSDYTTGTLYGAIAMQQQLVSADVIAVEQYLANLAGIQL